MTKSSISRIVRTALVVLTTQCLFAGSACNKSIGPVVPPDTTRLLVGLADCWECTTIELRTFSRSSPAEPWNQVGTMMVANIGRTGLAPGRGLPTNEIPDIAMKHEGDGKAPAGVFGLSQSYGYDDGLKLRNDALPMTELTNTWSCVEDAESSRYNRTLDTAGVAPDWNSIEVMRRPDGLYSRLMIVDHNGALGGTVTKGGGSCIFFHVERGPGIPTAGCTSLSASDMDELVPFAGTGQKTVYVLMTRAWYHTEAARPGSGLPVIE